MNSSISKAAAAIYEERRNRSDKLRRIRQQQVHDKFPELDKLDREIAMSGAEMLFEAIDPDRPKTASARKQELIERRNQFIADHGIDPEFDQPAYECDICHDTGYTPAGRCSCYRATIMPLLIDHANLKGLSSISFEQFDENLFSDQTNISNGQGSMSPRENIIAIRNIVKRFADYISNEHSPASVDTSHDFVKSDLPQNMLFLGKPGTGKTYLMACLANYALTRGVTVFYVSAPELFEIMNELRVLQNSFNPEPVRYEQVTALYDSILHADLLLIDDLGTETRAANRYSELLTLIDRRLEPGLHTVISSNADASSLKQTYDERLLSRLMGNYAIYRFYGEDVRLEISRRRRNQSKL
ncbi:MAG: ATP-binding protein [Eubacteriales bacterium]|nr:ATP-binding protein [Eubacteriales bacterium]MDD3196795.1 ATP-binding protein [Eubacteriales bacterium]MDD4682112.1 ATP-binding protein [Eubacteriales bacterium]